MHRVFVKIGNFEIYTYGVMLVIAFLTGIAIAIKRNRNSRISREDILDFSLYLLISGVLGARLVYVALHLGEYLHNPISIINLREGGLAWHGALLGGFIAYFIFSKKRGIDVLEFLDLCAPSMLIGLAIGRIGCFMNGCCIGMETSSHWGMIFRDAGYTTPHYPTQLYECGLDLLVAGALVLWDKRKKFSGEIVLLMLSCYSLVRFFVEFFRLSPPRFMGLSIAQYSSIIIFLITIIWVLVKRGSSPDRKKE